MSILIKGMEMPAMCSECTFCGGLICPDNIYCCDCPSDAIYGKDITRAIEEDCRHPDCPLVPVPPHYDLIDHNALKIAVMNGDCETRVDFLKHTIDCINKAPVVIPSDMPIYGAEEGET